MSRGNRIAGFVVALVLAWGVMPLAQGDDGSRPSAPAGTCAMTASGQTAARTSGPDLIVGNVWQCAELGREGALGSGTIGMSCNTTACTIGDQGTNWWGLPNIDHPMISVNLFRLRRVDGSDRLMQLGQSWMKHGFGTALANECGLGCTGGHFNLNGPGCSDTYAAGQFVACDLGPRSMMNPYTGVMPFSADMGSSGGCFANFLANDHRDHVHDNISHRLQIKDVDLDPSLNVGAKYFSEGQYLVPHESVAPGTQNNNASYRRVLVSGQGACGNENAFLDFGFTHAQEPAINAWPGSGQSLIEPEPLVDGRGVLAYKVTHLGNVWRYEYVLYNMNMDRAMRSLSIPTPAGVVVTGTGFHHPLNHAPEPHTVNYANTPWAVSTSGGAVTWSTASFGTDPFANAVRFGTAYNFYFDANTPPTPVDATVGLFKTGGSVPASALGPSAGPVDCNNNGIEDRCDVSCGLPGCLVPNCALKADCNGNFVPDDCEPDCNNNGIADRCDIANLTSLDCDANAVPDECEPLVDCNNNLVRDACEAYADPLLDANDNGILDSCEPPLVGINRYVDDDAPGDPVPGWPLGSDPLENGTPSHPFDAIQEAIWAAADGDTVVVRDGTYLGPGNRELFYGGKRIAVRSENGPDSCIIDLQGFFLGAFFQNEGLFSRLEGFHFSNLHSNQQSANPGIFASSGSPTVVNCRFTTNGNRSVGAILTSSSRTVFSRCEFVGMQRAVRCFTSRPVLSNCIFRGGTVGVLSENGNGTADCVNSSSPRIINSTITGFTIGVQAATGSVVLVSDSVVWGNGTELTASLADLFASHSDVEGGYPGLGNINAAPMFVDAVNGDLRISAGSPCIDAGDNISNPLEATDFKGGPRQFDDPATSDTGLGTPPIVDMGAHEWADCNGNGIDDSVDIALGTSRDCNGNFVPDECEAFVDCNVTTIRDICDIADGTSQDCNHNFVPDECDVSSLASDDCNGNIVPDECESDCQPNGIADACDISSLTSADCTSNGVPDECESDCNGNLISDSCDLAACAGAPACADCNNNGRLDGCDIAGGSSLDMNGNGTPDECEPLPTLDWDPDDGKSRSLSFTVIPAVTATPGQCAIKITMLELQNPQPPNAAQFPAPDFGTFEAGTCTAVGEANGCARWIGPVSTYLESQDGPGLGNFHAARLQCTPHYYDWTLDGEIHVVGGEVAPSSTYAAQVYGPGCKFIEAGCAQIGPSVLMTTRRAGDIVAAFNPPSTTTQPDGIDVAQIVSKFKSLPGSPSKADAQVQPNVPELNADVSAIDITILVDNFKGLAYPFSGPCVCPSTVTCGSTPCSSPTPCGDGTCVKTCDGGFNVGLPCINNTHCPSSTCGTGFCRDRCGRCSP